ncbi:alpha/beta hydrolase family protein [Shewanella surugensis]|uniref:Uncharacterized protein n=1 Tax=Shewanella surugensis TaxID=212020 RepID=A0ABT0LGY9_9GAMM|nr:hypothetical protein [Shewanella surugensis]MCL1126964.1 hypothetical protein [Shewanella surugensis]
MKIASLLLFASLTVFISACNDSSSSTITQTQTEVKTGVLLNNGPVSQLPYVTSTHAGVTNDNGEFQYQEGEDIVFYLGTADRNILFPKLTSNAIISLSSWYDSYQDINIPININRLLMTLDEDSNSSNGIQIVEVGKLESIHESTVNFSSTTDNFEINLLIFDELKSLFLANTGRGQLISESAAAIAFHRYIQPQSSFYDPSDLTLGLTVPLPHELRASDFGYSNIDNDANYVLHRDTIFEHQLTTKQTISKTENIYNHSQEQVFDLNISATSAKYSITKNDDEIVNFTSSTQQQGSFTSFTTPTLYTKEELKQSYIDELNLTVAERALIYPVFPYVAIPPYDQSVYTTTITYYSATPDGNTIELSAYIAFPASAVDSQLDSDEMKILSYQKYTGENVGKADSAAQLLGNLAASNGYFVVASYYLGNGVAEEAIPAYLIEDAAATFSLDALNAFQQFYNEQYSEQTPIDITANSTTLFGYSQGGHSTIALMLRYLYQGYTNLAATWAGEGPYNLTKTMDGMMAAYFDNSDENYLNYTEYALVPYQVGFLKGYILPGFREYYGLDIDDDDIFLETSLLGNTVYTLKPSFALAYIYTHEYDTLKSLLFKNSLTSMSDITLLDSDTGNDVSLQDYMIDNQINFPIYLYQYEEDVLVTEGNYDDMATLLESDIINNISSSRGVCEVTSEGVIAALDQKLLNLLTLDPSGAHVLCGFYMLNDFIGSFE